MKFPANPTDKMIFEITSGVFYQYNTNQQTWVKLEGFGEFIPLATPTQDGLMTNEDYIKVQGLLIPPPNTTMTNKGCNFKFDDGTFGFRSSKDDIHIDYELSVIDRDEKGVKIERKELFQIHENTYGLDFRVNLDQLVSELEKRGQLTYKKRQGQQGPVGKRGPKGQDKLDTGPAGKKGPRGKNAIWPSEVTQDAIGVVNELGRGIVHISTEEITPDENYLVVTRANIGNLNYCPEFVKPVNINSPWVVVIDERQDITKLFTECDISEQCGFENCGVRTFVIPICSTRLYYVDFKAIEIAIKDQFLRLLGEMKAAKEKLVNEWLDKMIEVFVEQKTALCCATENAMTRTANQKVRERVENLRVEAATAGLQLVVDGSAAERDTTSLNSQTGGAGSGGGGADGDGGESCIFPGGQEPPGPAPVDPDIICPPLIIVALSCVSNTSSAKGTTIELEEGEYTAEIVDCCCHDEKNQVFFALATLEFPTLNEDGEETTASLTIGDAGGVDTIEGASAEFIGNAGAFRHLGGKINIWIPFSGSCIVGNIQIAIRRTDCTEDNEPERMLSQDKMLSRAHRPEHCATAPILIDGTGDDSDVFICDMNLEQIMWYEAGWRTGACCGVEVVAGGITWIVVKRSIGNDVTCGGGESLLTPCIKEAIEQIGTHPSIAFPTVNGEEFMGKPTTVQRLYRDIDLEIEIMDKILKGEVIQSKGNVIENIEAILFPLDSASSP